MTVATTAAPVTTSYLYDGDGRRVQKTVGSTTTTFVYDAQGHLAAGYGGPTNPLSGTTYLTDDHLGSTRLVTSATGTALQRFDYAPFGEELTAGIDGRTAPYSTNQYPTAMLDGTSEKFSGKERDAETGLDFFGARYFSGAQGRFTSPDEPLLAQREEDPQSWNLYIYGLNNPLRFTDPDGHEPCENGINPDNGNICTVVTPKPKPEPVDPGQIAIGGIKDFLNLIPLVANATYALTENTPGYNGPRVRMPSFTSTNQSQQRGAVISAAVFFFGGRGINLIGENAQNVRTIGSGRLAGFLRADTDLTGGAESASKVFLDQAGRLPQGEFDRVVKEGKEVVFREMSGTGTPKVEIIDHTQKTLEKVTFNK